MRPEGVDTEECVFKTVERAKERSMVKNALFAHPEPRLSKIVECAVSTNMAEDDPVITEVTYA
jgi:hypothetical protein